VCSELFFGLIGDSFLSSTEFFLANEKVVFERCHVLIELEDERAGSWDVVVENVCIGHAGKVLDNSS